MDDWKDIFFKSGIRAIMTAPRGQPSHNLLDAFHRAYHEFEMTQCFLAEKKIMSLPTTTRISIKTKTLDAGKSARYNSGKVLRNRRIPLSEHILSALRDLVNLNS